MQGAQLFATAVCVGIACSHSLAAEGPTIAGPIGGADIRSAQLPPPGLYGGMLLLGSPAYDFVDGHGKTIRALSAARLTKWFDGPFFIYVPDVKVLGGSIGLAGIVPNGALCGHLFANNPSECKSGIGDPYVEISWSRSFGYLRPSRFPGALPIHQGLTTMVGFGAVLPLGQYDPTDLTTQARSIGTNIYDFAPSLAFTYTTPPIFAEGTEFSAKMYLNNYLTNPATDYATGSIFNVDFAISERIGRFQVGLAGSYLLQVTDDTQFGVLIPPDGRRAKGLALGAIVNYDMPEIEASVKIKPIAAVRAENTVYFWGISIGWIKKF